MGIISAVIAPLLYNTNLQLFNKKLLIFNWPSIFFNKVVFPAPRNPLKTVTGSFFHFIKKYKLITIIYRKHDISSHLMSKISKSIQIVFIEIVQ